MNIDQKLLINGSIGLRVDIAIFTAQAEYLAAMSARRFSMAERWKENLLISIAARQRLCAMIREVGIMKHWEYIGYQRSHNMEQFIYFESIVKKHQRGLDTTHQIP